MAESPDLPRITRDGTRITVVGSIRTPAERDLLREQIGAAASQRQTAADIVVDVAGAGYLDSYALSTLVVAARKCVDVGAGLVLEGVSAEQLKLIQVTNVDEVLAAHGARVKPSKQTAA